LDKNSVSDQVATILEEVYGEITYYTEDDFIDILENQDIYNGSEKINNENN
jgi:hypothetical protein